MSVRMLHRLRRHICLQELQLLQGWIDDDPKLFTADILLNLLLSYRDIQVSLRGWRGRVGGWNLKLQDRGEV